MRKREFIKRAVPFTLAVIMVVGTLLSVFAGIL